MFCGCSTRCDGKPIVFPKPTHGTEKGLLPYRTAAECIDWTVPCRSIFEREKPLADNTLRRIARGLDKFTIKSVNPFIIPVGYGERKGQKPRINGIDEPLSTIVSTVKQACVAPCLTPYIMANNTRNTGAALSEPVPTVTTGNRNFLTAASLIQYHSEQSRSEVRGQVIDKPLMTVDASPRYGLMSAHIVKYYSGDNYSAVSDPLHTITVKERNALVESHLCLFRNNQDCKLISEPLPTLCAGGGHIAEIRTTIVKYNTAYSYGHWEDIRALLNEYCGYSLASDEILLMEIDGEDFFISDIGMRMLTPRELYRAQGFPDDYIIDFDVNGKQYSRSAQVARCGNAVPPPFAEALVRANLPELCGEKHTLMRELQELKEAE